MATIKRYSFQSEQQATDLIALLEIQGTIVQLGFKNDTYDVDVLWQNEAPINWTQFESYRTPTHLFAGEVLKTEEELQAEKETNKKATRNEILKQGIIVNNIWFDEDKLTQFTVMAQMVASMGHLSFEWGFEDGFAPITIQDAFNTAIQASLQFQQIYKDYA